jgi:signal transduction histidine kinase
VLSERVRIETRRVFDSEPIHTVGRLTYMRMAVMPAIVALLTGASFLDPARWRTLALGSTLAGALVLFAYELWAMRQRRTRRWIPAFFGSFIIQTIALVATGGVHSPFLPALVLAGIIAGAMLSGPEAWVLPGAQIAVVVVLAALQSNEAFTDLRPIFWRGETSAAANAIHVVTVAGATVVLLLVATRAGRILRQSYERVLARVLSARDDTLAEHRAHAREMAALSAEIAHELKNPLATVKGLAALMARVPGDMKNGERLEVLRREVERMQVTLEEFGSFSRPLLPLSLEVVPLSHVVTEVLGLHEGMAQAAGVSLEVETRGDDAVRCDRGKVRQILVNLIQNGIQASPSGVTLRLEIEPAPGEMIALRVLDEGSGLDAEVADRIFEAGVTTKATGSGIGLGVSLGLARQHGGTLTLDPRPTGGCVAELCLPKAGPKESL